MAEVSVKSTLQIWSKMTDMKYIYGTVFTTMKEKSKYEVFVKSASYDFTNTWFISVKFDIEVEI